jgi:hypothetical protein
MVMLDGKVALEFPLTESIYGSFGPNSLTVTESGKLIEKWVKVK